MSADLLLVLLGADDPHAAVDPEAVAPALRRYQTTKWFDSAMWSFAVESWNEAMPAERQARHTYCLRHKHDWVGLPMDEGAKVCRRCLAYKVEN